MVSQHALEVVSQHAFQQVSRGVLSQHALQVVSQHALQQVSRGVPGLGVCSKLVPSLGGCLLPGGLLLEGCLVRGVCSGGLISQNALRQTPPGDMTAGADGTHPTGMHSCFLCKFIEMYHSESALLVLRDVKFL